MACEQDAMWFAYLQRKGLITPEGFLVEEPPLIFAAEPVAPAPDADKANGASEPTDQNEVSGDDPKASAADLKLLQTSRKPE
jgi:hypothetical protein